MLGWHISIYRQADSGVSPAVADSRDGTRLAVWQIGLGGLDWLIELVREKMAHRRSLGRKLSDKSRCVHHRRRTSGCSDACARCRMKGSAGDCAGPLNLASGDLSVRCYTPGDCGGQL
jgi:hypothetical protein